MSEVNNVKVSIEEKRQKAKEIIHSMKGMPLSDVKEIISFFCPLAIKLSEEKLVLN